MNKIAKYSLAAIAAVGLVGGVGLYTATQAFAETSTTYTKIVENLASKFNLDKAAVQQVFTTTREQAAEDRLDDAVDEGRITAAQKSLIVAKQKEVQTQIETINAKQLTAEDRATQLKELTESVRDWADKNDIPVGLVFAGGVRGRVGGMGKMGGGMMFEGME